MTMTAIVQHDFYLLVMALTGVLGFFICNSLKNILADRTAWRFLSLFALTHGLVNIFRILKQFTSLFPNVEIAVPIFTFLASSFLLGFALNIRTFSGDFSKLRRFWYLPLLMGTSGLALSLYAFALTQAMFVGLPAILLTAKVFFRREVFKVRKTCFCHKTNGIWLIIMASNFVLVSVGILQFNTMLTSSLVFFSSAMWLASIWFCSRISNEEETSFAVKQNFKLLNYFLPGALALMFPAGFLISVALSGSAFHFEVQSKANLLVTLQTLIKGRFTQAEMMAGQLANHHEVKEMNSNMVESLHMIVDQFAAVTPNSVIYILDTEGTTISSSNRHEKDSFMGKNFSFRPYFQDAMAGRKGSFLSRGSVSNVFGYYCTFPIKSNADEIVGIAVVKINLEKLARFFPDNISTAILDKEFNLVSSNRPNLFWLGIQPLAENDFIKVESDFLVRDGINLFYALPAKIANKGIDTFVWKHPFNDSGWQFLVVDSARFLIWSRLLGISITLIGTVVILSVSAFWNLSLGAAAKIEKSSKVYQTLVEGSSNIVVLIDIYGNIQAINGAGKEELGLKEDAPMLRLPEYWDGISREKVREALQQGLAGKKVVCEAAKLDADGQKSYWELILNPIIEEDSPPKQLIGIFHNFTERKLAAQLLNQEKDLTTSILNTAQAIILLMDMSGKVLRMNQYFYDLTGYKQEDVIGENWLEKFIPELDFHRVSSYFRQYVNNIGSTPLINKIKAADGKILEIEWKNRIVKGTAGEAIGVISVGQDITHHLKLESNLRESKTKFAMLNNCFIRFSSSPEENISILTEAAWLLTGSDTTLVKRLEDDRFVLIAKASISDDLLNELAPECKPNAEIFNMGKEPQILPEIKNLSNNCQCFHPYDAAVFCNIFAGDKPTGAIFCCFQDRVPEFSEEELDLFSIIAQAIGIEVERDKEKKALQNAIDALAARNRRMSLEMDIARTVHRSFLPSSPPECQNFAIGFKFKPCFSVGGDYFDFIPRPEIGKMGIFFADISGHGVAGALLSSMLKMILFSVTQNCPPPKEVLDKMNSQIEDNFPAGYFVSAFYALLDENSNQIELANAAPEPALVLRKDGRIEIICRGGQPMGLLPAEFTDEQTFAGTSVSLDSGDKLIFFTDGLTDIKISENERIGLDRICRWLSENAECDAQTLCETVYQRAVTSAIQKGIDDDIMLLAIARR